jgi:N-acetylmuramic acid 6-phosphate etherase
MIQLGKVKGNKMVDMQLSNLKLIDRGVRMIMDELSIDAETAQKLLLENGNNVRNSINAYKGHA